MSHKPTSASGTATKDGLREYSRFSKEYLMDRPIIDLWPFQNYVEHDDNPEAMGNGTPEFAEINTAEIGGVLVATSNDAYGHLIVLPYWIDPAAQIDFRVLWSNSQSAGTGTFDVAVKYTPIDVSAESVALAIGATALDSTIDSQADLAANVPLWTEWGYINAEKTGVKDLTPGDDLLAITTIGTLTTITSASMIQMQMRAYRKYI